MKMFLAVFITFSQNEQQQTSSHSEEVLLLILGIAFIVLGFVLRRWLNHRNDKKQNKLNSLVNKQTDVTIS
jgi:uncharacterized membrane protein